MKINEKIKNLRIEHDMTQDDLARICYVSRNAVSKWERNKGYPNINSLKLISSHFNISIDDLLNEDSLHFTIKVLEDNQTLTNKIFLITTIIISFFYALLLTLGQNYLFSIDPTSGFTWFLLIAPLLSMIMGIVIGLFLNNSKLILICILSCFVLEVIFDALFTVNANFTFDFLYIVILFLSVLITTSIKLGKNNASSSLVNKILSICVLIITISIFTTQLARSIYYVNNGLEVGHLGPFNLVPLFYILTFIIPFIFEILWIIISFSKRNKGTS